MVLKWPFEHKIIFERLPGDCCSQAAEARWEHCQRKCESSRNQTETRMVGDQSEGKQGQKWLTFSWVTPLFQGWTWRLSADETWKSLLTGTWERREQLRQTTNRLNQTFKPWKHNQDWCTLVLRWQKQQGCWSCRPPRISKYFRSTNWIQIAFKW